jgi:hypothetical protein
MNFFFSGSSFLLSSLTILRMVSPLSRAKMYWSCPPSESSSCPESGVPFGAIPLLFLILSLESFFSPNSAKTSFSFFVT